MDENNENLFDNRGQFVLFSGTSLEGNGAFRHLNDLFLVLYVLVSKCISRDRIFLSIDLSILKQLDNKTKSKRVNLFGKDYTFSSFFNEHIAQENFISANQFQDKFKRGDNSLVFFASGHGDISGLTIDSYDDGNHTFLSSDYFEDIADYKNSTYLVLSQCKAGAFHHLDTRRKICVMGASEYQNSLSIPINLMVNHPSITHLSFEDNIAINPFIFSFFMLMLDVKDGIKYNKKKNVINIFKYIAPSTIHYVSNLYQNKKIVVTKEFIESENNRFEYIIENLVIQQPFLLNKILASETYLD